MRTKKWIGRYREDVIGEDGKRHRRIRSVVFGPVREVSKRQAQRKLSECLAAINQGTHKPEVIITFEHFVLERFEPNILPTIRFSTRRLYRSLSRKHLLPFFGRMRLSEIGAADVQMFLTETAKRVAPRTVLRCGIDCPRYFPLRSAGAMCSQTPSRGPKFPS
jgi:hypothetical protein